MGVVLLWRKQMIEVLTLENLKLYTKLLMQYIDGNDGQSNDLIEMTENILGISKSQDDENNEN